MRAQYVWPAGTPVLLLGFRSDFPSEVDLDRGWTTAAAGRLRESYRPGSPVLMDVGPMAMDIPARGWKSHTLFRSGGGGWAAGKDDAAYAAFIHDAWKRAFLITTEDATPVHLCRSFIMIQSEPYFPEMYGSGDSPLVNRLEGMTEPSLHDLLPLVSEIAADVSWHMGGYYGWCSAELDACGEPLR